ncbi:unnamed protein product, partial [Lymnaea stagnalis]
MELATTFLLPFNRLKRLPENIDALRNLRYVDMRSNVMTSIPPIFFNNQCLEYVDCSNNMIKVIPPTIKKCLWLHTFIAVDNKLRTLPA